jgi:hypothetical protein
LDAWDRDHESASKGHRDRAPGCTECTTILVLGTRDMSMSMHVARRRVEAAAVVTTADASACATKLENELGCIQSARASSPEAQAHAGAALSLALAGASRRRLDCMRLSSRSNDPSTRSIVARGFEGIPHLKSRSRVSSAVPDAGANSCRSQALTSATTAPEGTLRPPAACAAAASTRGKTSMTRRGPNGLSNAHTFCVPALPLPCRSLTLPCPRPHSPPARTAAGGAAAAAGCSSTAAGIKSSPAGAGVRCGTGGTAPAAAAAGGTEARYTAARAPCSQAGSAGPAVAAAGAAAAAPCPALPALLCASSSAAADDARARERAGHGASGGIRPARSPSSTPRSVGSTQSRRPV